MSIAAIGVIVIASALVSAGLIAVLLPTLAGVEQSLASLAHAHADAAMLSRTHGQSATPTTMTRTSPSMWLLGRASLRFP